MLGSESLRVKGSLVKCLYRWKKGNLEKDSNLSKETNHKNSKFNCKLQGDFLYIYGLKIARG